MHKELSTGQKRTVEELALRQLAKKELTN